MFKKIHLDNNPWFIIPFLLWMIAGGFLLATHNERDLFEFVNSRNNPTADVFMWWATELGDGTAMSIILLSVFALPGFRNRWYFFAAIACNAVPAILAQILKGIFNHPRPLTVFKDQSWVHHLEIWPSLYAHSFPSGHTTGSFSLFCFLSLLLPRKYSFWAFPFFLLALLVGYSRLYLSAHFFADIYVGSLVGTLGCLAMYRVIRTTHGRFFRLKEEGMQAQ